MSARPSRFADGRHPLITPVRTQAGPDGVQIEGLDAPLFWAAAALRLVDAREGQAILRLEPDEGARLTVFDEEAQALRW